MKLYAQTLGGGSPLLMLHGLFGSSDNLKTVARKLADQYQVHLLDLRNHGRSPHHHLMNYQVMANDVQAYMDASGLADSFVFGHSMGGKVAMQLALSSPERIVGLAIGDIAPVDYPPHYNATLEGLLSIDVTTLASRTQADNLLKHYVTEAGVRQFLLKNLVKLGSKGFRWRMNLEAIAQNYPCLSAGISCQSCQFPGRVLFIRGQHSDYIKPVHKEIVEKLFPAAELKIVANAGHWLHVDNPDMFTRIVGRFLAVA